MRKERSIVDKYTCIDTVLYNSSNLLLIETRRSKENIAYMLCDGMSMSMDKKYNIPVKWDPYMTIPTIEGYPELKGDLIMIYFPFECAGLKEAGLELATYINDNMKKYDQIVLIGHSKGGVCLANIAKWLERRVYMILISAPFLGTNMVNKDKVRRRLTMPLEYKIYERFYNQHKVDLDLALDSEFLRDCDYSGVTRHRCKNVISETRNVYTFMDLGCKYINHRMFYAHGDGFVTVSTQEILSRLYKNVETLYIDASHMNSLTRYLSFDNKYII